MPTVFRLTKRIRAATAFDGEGSRLFGGRWNSKGVRMVYTSQSLSLAILENLVHLDAEAILTSKFAFRTAHFDDRLCHTLDPSTLPVEWNGDEISLATIKIGDTWIHSQQSAVLAVPSVLAPRETNYLFNPEHPDFEKVDIGPVTGFRIPPRLGRD